MKKYLRFGLAALAFASCSKNDFTPYSPEDVVKAEYDAKFIAEFGKPAANQDWGFGSGTRAFTRAAGYGVGPLANGNEWTSKGFLPPEPLTDGQKLRVQYYFQMHKITNPNRPDNLSQDFFMQQVYDGGTDPMEKNYQNPTTTYSPETYKAANGDWVDSGEMMNKLTAGPDNIHVLNFNNGNCGTYDNVSNWNSTDVNDTKQQHKDQIELMLNTPTSCFGYLSSTTSMQYNNYWTLVSYQDIDNYCNNNAAYQTWLASHKDAQGQPIADAIVGDRWQRSFIGFDFEMLPGENIYTDEYFYIKLDQTSFSEEKVYNGTDVVAASTVGQVVTVSEWDKRLYLYKQGTTEKIRLVKSGLNTICGTSETWTDDPLTYRPEGGNVYQRIDNIYTAISAGKLPVESSAGKTWVTPSSCADGYYSDWIVSFMPATSGSTDVTYQGRIMAEDLTVADKSDWDFNDVVFDWAIKDGKAYIKLLAAGGTLPLTIGGELINGEVVGGVEVHSAAGLGKYMVNTGVNQGPAYKEFVLEGEHNSYTGTNANANAIKLHVKKSVNGVQTWVEITAEQGEPAGKFNCPVGTKWCEEYANIKRVYSSFAAWVVDTSVTWAVNPVDKYVDYKDVEENKKEAPLTD
jgi:hypothetical protein